MNAFRSSGPLKAAIVFAAAVSFALVLGCISIVQAQTSGSVRHFLFVASGNGPMTLSEYDMDNGFSLVTQVSLPTNYDGNGPRGIVASAADAMLYISHGFSHTGSPYGYYIAKYDLSGNQLVWDLSYPFPIDSHAITPSGTTIYMPTGENNPASTWEIIDASSGAVSGSISSGEPGAHNTIVSNNGAHVYMGSSPVGSNYLVVANTSDNTIIQKIGPVVGGTGVRPFAINSRETLAFITIDGLLGFNVGDISTGKILYAVHVAGFPTCSLTTDTCSHGISLSPDDREIYVVDTPHNYVHVFDVTGLPGSAPVQVADIPLAHPFTATGTWVTHSLDGRFVIIGESGDVIDTGTHAIVGFIPALSLTKEFTEVDFLNGIPYFSPLSRSGVGYPDSTPPSFSPAPGAYSTAQSVTLSDAAAGATIFYTTDGSTPTTSSTVYSAAIAVSSTTTINAIATAAGFNTSTVASGTYTIQAVATPGFSPAPGTYSTTQSVTLSDATAGATIFYTTDGSTPTTSSTVYSAAIAVSSTTTIKAIATAPGFSTSAVASGTYTIQTAASTPGFSPAPGTYTTAQSVTLSDATAGATIFYTTDGSTPTTSSTVYSAAIAVSSTTTIKAIATAPGFSTSAVASGTYTIALFLTSISLNPALLTGGNSSTGTVTLNTPAPAGGVVVTLSSEGNFARVPTSVKVASGATSATFTVSTRKVKATSTVTISGTLGITKSVTLTVTP